MVVTDRSGLLAAGLLTVLLINTVLLIAGPRQNSQNGPEKRADSQKTVHFVENKRSLLLIY